jgi:hypothetical protein
MRCRRSGIAAGWQQHLRFIKREHQQSEKNAFCAPVVHGLLCDKSAHDSQAIGAVSNQRGSGESHGQGSDEGRDNRELTGLPWQKPGCLPMTFFSMSELFFVS